MIEPQILRTRLCDHVDEVRRAAADNEFVDVEHAERLRQSLEEALSRWASLDDDQRAVLAGAVEYFIRTHDEEDDLRSPIGFEDDAEVVRG